MSDLENKSQINCPCGLQALYSNCCEPYILRTKHATTALDLMRSRYTAYVVQNADYLIETTAAATRKFHNKKALLDWAKQNQWVKLEILNHSETKVEFKAYYLDELLQLQVHHEKSKFQFIDKEWFYVDYES